MSDILFSVFPNENFVDIGLYQYGWEQCEPSHSFGPAARNHYVFHYVISGTGTLMANDSSGNTIKYQVKSGQGFMLFPNQINTYIADQDLPWEYTWVEFDGLRAKEIVSTAGLSPDHPVYHAGSKDLRNDERNAIYCPASGFFFRVAISYDRPFISVFRLFHAFRCYRAHESEWKDQGFLHKRSFILY